MADMGFSASDRRRLVAFAEREGLLGRRRRASLPPPTDCCIDDSADKTREKHVECVVLDEIIQSVLLNLHSVEDSLEFWDSKAEGNHPRKIYFMTFERGPKAFAEMACKALQRISHPYKFLIDSAHGMNRLRAERMNALRNIKQCLAKFLTEIFTQVDAYKDHFHENSTTSLSTLFKVVNKLYQNLEPALKSVVEKDPGQFDRVHLVDVAISDWTVELSMEAISLVYKNVHKFDSAISAELSDHGKPKNVSTYWLPYTVASIAFVGCSIWLLRNSSLEGTKQILMGMWSARVKKTVISIRDELIDGSAGDDHLERRRQEVAMMEDSLNRQMNTFFQNSTRLRASDLSEDELLKHVFKSHESIMTGAVSRSKIWDTWTLTTDPDLYRALLIKIDKHALRFQQELLGVSEFIKRHAFNFAIIDVLPAAGVFAILFSLALSYRRGTARAKALSRKTAIGLLLASIEIDITTYQNLVQYQQKDGAACTFGMVIYRLDNLLSAVEPNARKLGEWKNLRNDLITLARPQTSCEERKSILSRLKLTYQSLGVAARMD